jgi:Fe-S-cluster containining protein
MDAGELYRSLMAALKRAYEEREEQARALAALAARVDQLTEILTGNGTLDPGHRRLIDKRSDRAAAALPRTVHLRQYVDKYQVPGADLDCAALVHLCRARCCAFSFELTAQDVEEGVVRWELEAPYLIRHEPDGYCSHLDRASSGGCTVYAQRPAACRTFDCRGDPRVWIDFDARIPAPLPDGLVPPKLPG